MPTYAVIEKATGAEVYRYSHDAPEPWHGMEFDTHDHVEQPPEPVINGNGSIEGQVVRVLTKLEYLRRFTQDERIAIRAAAAQSPVLDDYLELLKEATEVRTDDPDIVAALTTLTLVGLLPPHRPAEILA